MVASIPC